jgi:hypothetical protein
MRSLRAALVIAGLTLGLVFPGSASAVIVDIQLAPTAQLGPGGATVSVPVTVTCDTASADVFVNLTQRHDRNRVARGFASVDVTCTGSAQTLTVVVNNTSDIPFKAKSAVASAELLGCDPTGQQCESDTDVEVIEILKT